MHQLREEVRSAIDVIVHEDDVFGVACGHSLIRRDGETGVLGDADKVDVWELPFDHIRGVIEGPVVDENDIVSAGLPCEVLEAASREINSAECRDDDVDFVRM